MSDDDQTNDSTPPGPRAAPAKKKATRKKKKASSLTAGRKKVARRAAPAEAKSAEGLQTATASEPDAPPLVPTDTAAESPSVAPMPPPVPETAHGVSGALALWGPLIIIGFLVAVLKLGDGNAVAPPAERSAELPALPLAIQIGDAVALGAAEEGFAGDVAADSAGSGPTLSATDEFDALSLTLPSTGSAASDLAAAFAQSGGTDVTSGKHTGSVLPAPAAQATVGSTSTQSLWGALPTIAAQPGDASLANPWAGSTGGGAAPSPWDPNAEFGLAPSGTDWPPPPDNAGAIGPMVGNPATPALPSAPGITPPPGWPPQPVYVPCAPPYYWCLAPALPIQGPAVPPLPGY